MSYPTGLTPNSLPLTSDTAPAESVNSTARIQSAAQSSRSAAVDEIAADSAKVSLAGAMLSEAASGSDVRFDKVAALGQSIQGGSYGIPSADVASKLIDTLLK